MEKKGRREQREGYKYSSTLCVTVTVVVLCYFEYRIVARGIYRIDYPKFVQRVRTEQRKQFGVRRLGQQGGLPRTEKRRRKAEMVALLWGYMDNGWYAPLDSVHREGHSSGNDREEGNAITKL
jgi:hypothetical protein